MKYIDPAGLPPEVARLLFEAWLVHLAEPLGLTQNSSGGTSEESQATFGDPSGDHFVVRENGLAVVVERTVHLSASTVAGLVDDAIVKVAEGDFGGVQVYAVEMQLQNMDYFGGGAIHFMRILGDQVHIEGPRRLSDAVVLDFEESLIDGTTELLTAPASKVSALIYAPGPTQSELTRRTAHGVSEVATAVVAFATGRATKATPAMFPLRDPEDLASALARRHDFSILGLARDSISLDVFSGLRMLGGTDSVLRARGSLLAYHAALQQTVPEVAVMLFVTSIEALLAPRAEWGKTQVTTRFIKGLIDLCPQAVDEMVAHANVEEAFAFRRYGSPRSQRRDLLTRIYEARSLITHTGLEVAPTTMQAMSEPRAMQVALLSDLARAAILGYLQAPRSSLIGHPSRQAPSESAKDGDSQDGVS